MNYTASDSHITSYYSKTYVTDRMIDDKTTSKYPNFMHEEV